jgi:hypothetical protein
MQTNTCPSFNGFTPVNGVARPTGSDAQKQTERLAQARAEILEMMFDESSASEYAELLSEMMYAYLYRPSSGEETGLAVPPIAALNATHTTGRLIRHITALAELTARLGESERT